MKWIHHFQLFLFDFDGLLVNTEHLHYQAYVNVLAKRGHELPLTFANFFELAHLNASAWKEALYAAIPTLDRNWEAIYQEKKRAFTELLSSGPIEMMAGAEELLISLEKAAITRCVVTNSILEHIEIIRARLPVLQTINHWITREDYHLAKPSPECYLLAIERYGKPGDRIIGFEDSFRGLEALRATKALPVLVCPNHHPLLKVAMNSQLIHFESFSQVLAKPQELL